MSIPGDARFRLGPSKRAFALDLLVSLAEQDEEAVRLRRQAFEEGQSYFVMPAAADLNFRPLWGYEPYEQLMAPRG